MRQAVLQSLPPDNGLYMPEQIPILPDSFFRNLPTMTFPEIAFRIASSYLEENVPPKVLKSIVEEAINFQAPVITIDQKLSILELFHGPTMAFKDFGARFMARLMNYFWSDHKDQLRILVATSGDTGGAVAAGFHGLDNIEVIILYPKGKVSQLQEAQLTTWGDNIKALEIDGDFDACQKLVKMAFLDEELNNSMQLSSANSINIARLIPQTFYYFNAFNQIKPNTPITFCVPSGNFGNLTAGLLAKKMGLPIAKVIAATNINDVVPQYLLTSEFHPTRARVTLSNAMDIGHPSNFARILDLYGSTWNKIRQDIDGFSVTDEETVDQIKFNHLKNGYVMDPHTAVGTHAARQYQITHPESDVIVLSTAHPIKFQSELKDKLSFSIPYPANINQFLEKPSKKMSLKSDFEDFKSFLMNS